MRKVKRRRVTDETSEVDPSLTARTFVYRGFNSPDIFASICNWLPIEDVLQMELCCRLFRNQCLALLSRCYWTRRLKSGLASRGIGPELVQVMHQEGSIMSGSGPLQILSGAQWQANDVDIFEYNYNDTISKTPDQGSRLCNWLWEAVGKKEEQTSFGSYDKPKSRHPAQINGVRNFHFEDDKMIQLVELVDRSYLWTPDEAKPHVAYDGDDIPLDDPADGLAEIEEEQYFALDSSNAVPEATRFFRSSWDREGFVFHVNEQGVVYPIRSSQHRRRIIDFILADFDLDFLKITFDGRRLVLHRKRAVRERKSEYHFNQTELNAEQANARCADRCRKYVARGYEIIGMREQTKYPTLGNQQVAVDVFMIRDKCLESILDTNAANVWLGGMAEAFQDSNLYSAQRQLWDGTKCSTMDLSKAAMCLFSRTRQRAKSDFVQDELHKALCPLGIPWKPFDSSFQCSRCCS